MKLNKVILYRKIVISTLSISLLLLLIFPMYDTWIPYSYENIKEGWSASYFFSDEDTYKLILPFYVFYPLLFLSKKRFLQLLLKIILLIFACFFFYWAYMLVSMPTQDFIPSYGIFLLMTILPQLVYILYMDSWVKYHSEINEAK